MRADPVAGAPGSSHPIRERRLWLELSQRELAKRSRVALRTICSVERGARCRVTTQRKLLRALGLAFEEREDYFGPL